MDIDRSRFLLLTASLAAAACNQTPPATIPGTGGIDPATAKDEPNPGEGEPTAESSSPQVWLEIEPGSEDAPDSRATGECENGSVRGPITCQISPPSGHCESFHSTQQMCDDLPEYMYPRVAEAAVDCLHAASGTQRICTWEIWGECIEAGLQVACVEPSTRGRCQSISSACGGSIDVFHCQQALSSVEERFVEPLASCVQELCEVPFCMSDLQYMI